MLACRCRSIRRLPTGCPKRCSIGCSLAAGSWFRLDRGNSPAWYSRFVRMRRRARFKEALRLVDEEPVLDAELLSLGRWIAQYYCAPLGEVLRSMTPLSGEVRKTKLYSLTDAGRDTARQLLLGADEEDPTLQILRLLEARPLSASYLQKKLPNALSVIRSLEKKGFVAMEDLEAQRDPLRASATRLRASWLGSCARRPEADQARARTARVPGTASGHAQPGAVGSIRQRRQPGRAFAGAPEPDRARTGSAHRRLHHRRSAAHAQSASTGSVPAD